MPPLTTSAAAPLLLLPLSVTLSAWSCRLLSPWVSSCCFLSAHHEENRCRLRRTMAQCAGARALFPDRSGFVAAAARRKAAADSILPVSDYAVCTFLHACCYESRPPLRTVRRRRSFFRTETKRVASGFRSSRRRRGVCFGADEAFREKSRREISSRRR